LETQPATITLHGFTNIMHAWAKIIEHQNGRFADSNHLQGMDAGTRPYVSSSIDKCLAPSEKPNVKSK